MLNHIPLDNSLARSRTPASQDKALHICPVCPRLISTRTKSLTCCSRCSLTFHNSCPNAQERPTAGRTLKLDESMAAQEPWTRCLFAALSAVLSDNDTRSWNDFLCLPKLVLRAHAEKSHNKQTSNDVQRMCEQWLEGLAGPFGYHNALPTNGRARRR